MIRLLKRVRFWRNNQEVIPYIIWKYKSYFAGEEIIEGRNNRINIIKNISGKNALNKYFIKFI
jgi:hypothetical protein